MNRRRSSFLLCAADPLTRQMVAAGSLAPSGGNSQPWRFRGDASGMDILLDAGRTRNPMDIRYRGAFVAIGAAAENMRIAAAKAGVVTVVETFPGGEPDLVARVLPGAAKDLDGAASLFEWIARRSTNRHAAPAGDKVTAGEVDALSTVAGALGATALFLTDPADVASFSRILLAQPIACDTSRLHCTPHSSTKCGCPGSRLTRIVTAS